MKLITEIVFSQYMFPIGTIIPYAGDLSKIPYGWHVCDGTNGTPNLSERFLEGTTTTPKTFKDAGLPNIIGSAGDIQHVQAIYDNVNGAFYHVSRGTSRFEKYLDTELGEGFGNLYFDASRSSQIYGNSGTVQPKSYTVYYIMRVK